MHVTILARCSRMIAAALGATAAIVLASVLAGVAVADHDDSTHVPAESMEYGSYAKVVSDPSAFGGKALRYVDPGRATRSVTLPSEGERVVIRARNGSASGPGSAVGLRVTVDGKVVGEKTISSTSYAYYSFDTGVPEGTHKIGVEGYSLAGKDRAYLDAVRIVHKAPPPDADGDGVIDAGDNCPSIPNASQADADGDAQGDACDPQDNRDSDGDGVQNHQDNCVDAANPEQANNDADAQGDACDPDDDNDGRDDGGDFAPSDPNVQDPPPPTCKGTVVSAGEDLDAIVNSDPATTATTFCIEAGTYSLSQDLRPKEGDALVGEPGVVRTLSVPNIGEVTVPGEVPVKIRNGASLEKLVTVAGTVEMEWLDISGADGKYEANWQKGDPCANPSDDGLSCPRAGTGVGIAMGSSHNDSRLRWMRVHDNDAVGIANAHGYIGHLETFSNTSDANFVGFTGGGVKGVVEFEVEHFFTHDEQGNGLWCDHACADAGATMPNGAWFHHGLTVNNGRFGFRYEFSPRPAQSQIPHFLAEDIWSTGNEVAGMSVHDAQNAILRDSYFGKVNVDGVSYPANGSGPKAAQFTDSGRTDRTDLFNVEVYRNDFGGEVVSGCEKPDEVVYCHDNR